MIILHMTDYTILIRVTIAFEAHSHRQDKDEM